MREKNMAGPAADSTGSAALAQARHREMLRPSLTVAVPPPPAEPVAVTLLPRTTPLPAHAIAPHAPGR